MLEIADDIAISPEDHKATGNGFQTMADARGKWEQNATQEISKRTLAGSQEDQNGEKEKDAILSHSKRPREPDDEKRTSYSKKAKQNGQKEPNNQKNQKIKHINLQLPVPLVDRSTPLVYTGKTHLFGQ